MRNGKDSKTAKNTEVDANNSEQVAGTDTVTNQKSATAKAGKDKVFSVSADKGPLETVFRSVAIDDCVAGDAFTREGVESMLAKGEVAFSDGYYYAESADALKKWIVSVEGETSPAPAEEAAPESNVVPFQQSKETVSSEEAAEEPGMPKFEEHDVVINLKTGASANLVLDGDTLYAVTEDGKRKKFAPEKFRMADDAEFFKHQTAAAADVTPEPDNAPETPKAPAKSKAKKTEEPVAEEAKAIEAGTLIFNTEKDIVGAAVEVDGKLKAQYTVDGKVKVNALTGKWVLATEEQVDAFFASQETGIEKSEPAIQGEIALNPLTDEERERLAALEDSYEKVDGIERAIPFEKGKILNEIRQGKLYRDTHKTFGEYALARFGITREYAQNLAQIASIPELVAESIEAGTNVDISVNTANELLRDGNKIMKMLGVGKVELNVLAPVLRNSVALMVDIAPKDAQGNVELTPKFVSAFNDVLSAHLTDGTVEIDGKQMTVKAAAEQGLLNHSLREQVIETAAETIKTQSETIRTEMAEAKERQESGIGNGAGDAPDDAKVYKGKVPTLDTVCSKHGDTEILTIGTGKIVTRCGCKWHVDTERGLVAYEVDDKRVVRK